VKGYLYGKDKQNAPSGFAQYYQCKRWNTLPHAGGYQDQPHLLMELFEIIEYETYQYELFLERSAAARAKLEADLNARMKK